MTLTEVKNRYSAAAGCDALYEVREAKLGRVGFIALHDLSSGPGVGGIRRWSYGSDRDAVADAVRLAEQMSLKTSFAELPVGGAKAVLMDRPGLDLALAYGAMGEAIEALGGQYFSGADLGTGDEELRYVRAHTAHVNFIENAPASSTATGVLYAIDAALQHLDLEAPAISAVVQGVGSVGSLVAQGLLERGATLSVSDLRPERIAALQAHWPAVGVLPDGADLAAEATLLAPCANGPVVTAETLERLRCKILCGAANNQLATPCLAERLSERGVLYLPDFVVNAGAVIEGVLTRAEGATDETRARVAAELARIGTRVAELLHEADASGWTPLEVALDRIERPAPEC